MYLTQSCWQSSEHQAIGVLKEANPLHPILLPALHQTSAVKQCMDITMPMWLLLDDIWVVFLQSQVSTIVGETCNLQ